MQLLKRVFTAVVLIPIVLLLVLWAPIPLVAMVTGLVALLAVNELLKLSEAYAIRPLYWPTYIFVAALFVLLALGSMNDRPMLSTAIFIYGAGFAASLAAFLFLVIGMNRADLVTAFPAAITSVFGFCYIALPLGFLVQVRQQWSGAFLVLYYSSLSGPETFSPTSSDVPLAVI